MIGLPTMATAKQSQSQRHLLTDSEMEKKLNELWKNFCSSRNMLFPEIYETLFKKFEIDFFNYLDRQNLVEKSKFKKQDNIFNLLTGFSNFYLRAQLLNHAMEFWEMVLKWVNRWEISRISRVHKGSIFYFMASIALQDQNLDNGYFLIHKAYQEDCLTQEKDNPDTPASKTVHFNIRSKKNYLYPYLRLVWDFLSIYLIKYNSQNKRRLLRSTIYKKFILSSPSIDLLIYFTYTISKIRQIVLDESRIVKSDFAGLIELNLLFDLSLIIDKYVQYFKNTTNQTWYFYNTADDILNTGMLDNNYNFRQNNLNSVNNSQLNNFDETIQQLVNQTYNFPRKGNLSGLYYDICLCYCIRNFSAHNIHLTNTVSNNFNEILNKVLNVLFFCIEIY